MTDTFNILPVRKYASLNVMEPLVKNIAYEQITSMAFLRARRAMTDLASPYDTIEPRPGIPKSFEPDLERFVESSDEVGQFGYQEAFELLVRTRAGNCSNQTAG